VPFFVSQEALMTRTTQMAATAALAVSLVACAGNDAPQTGPMPAGMTPTTVEVANHNWMDMRVFVVHAGTRVRLGTVTSMGRQVFRLPATMQNTTGGIQLVADPIGSRSFHMLPTVMVSPGQKVNVRLENHLAISSISVR
jgi:hypothetical protein